MTVYRIQDSLGLPLWVRIRENEQAIAHGDPRDVNLWTPGMWEVWQEFLWVFQQLEKYSILDRVNALTKPGRSGSSPAQQYQYLIQGRHLDYIQLRATYPLSQFGITVVDAALEEY
jgi:hypothetical protein